jgi:hypothetical protein
MTTGRFLCLRFLRVCSRFRSRSYRWRLASHAFGRPQPHPPPLIVGNTPQLPPQAPPLIVGNTPQLPPQAPPPCSAFIYYIENRWNRLVNSGLINIIKAISKTKKLKRAKEISYFTRYHWKDPRAYEGFKTNLGVKTKSSSYTDRWKSIFPRQSL